MTNTETSPQSSSGLKNGLSGVFVTITLLFATGALAGFATAVLEDGEPSLLDLGIIAALLLAIIMMILFLRKFWLARKDEPVAASTKKARNWLYIAVAIGAALGAFTTNVGGADMETLFSNQPIPPLLALVSIAIWLIVVPMVTWAWWRSVDEHEATAYRDGAMVAAHVYLFIAPSWWLAARAGWVQPQDPLIVFLIVSIIWSAYWLYRKYT